MPGELVDHHVIVRPQPEATRIHNKGRYGRPLSGGALQLDLIEAAYLAEVGRLEVFRDGKPLTWSELVVDAVALEKEFEIRYLVYRDLRARGYVVHARLPGEAKAGSHFRLGPRGAEKFERAAHWVRTSSERSPFAFVDLARFADEAIQAATQPLLALVDEESDLTYYELSRDAPKGRVSSTPSPVLDATVLGDRVLVADPRARRELHEREFFGQPVATGIQLSLVEALHLAAQVRLRVSNGSTRDSLTVPQLRRQAKRVEPEIDLRLRVFDDLKTRGLIVKTGFKFGTHFRAYEARPEEGHAPYLIQAVPRAFEAEWAPTARAIRLSHSVRKRFYLAGVGGAHVEYLAFGRFRP